MFRSTYWHLIRLLYVPYHTEQFYWRFYSMLTSLQIYAPSTIIPQLNLLRHTSLRHSLVRSGSYSDACNKLLPDLIRVLKPHLLSRAERDCIGVVFFSQKRRDFLLRMLNRLNTCVELLL